MLPVIIVLPVKGNLHEKYENVKMTVQEAPRIAGHPALDVVNTVDPRGPTSGPAIDYLASYSDFVKWSRAARLLDEKQVRALLAMENADPARAAREFRRVLELRELVYRVFAATARHETPNSADVAQLGSLAALARSAQVLVREHDSFLWRWKESVAFDLPVLALADSAAALLTQYEASGSRIRVCEGAPCGWLFVDTSKAGKRRWCAMQMCGNRAKAKRLTKR